MSCCCCASESILIQDPASFLSHPWVILIPVCCLCFHSTVVHVLQDLVTTRPSERKKLAPCASAQSGPSGGSKMLIYTGEHNVWPLRCTALPLRVPFLILRRKACAVTATQSASTPRAHVARGSRSELCQLSLLPRRAGMNES